MSSSSTRDLHENVISQLAHSMNKVPIVRVDVVVSKLPRRHLALEHDVHLLKCAVFCLWQAEEAPDGGQQGQATPEEGLYKCKPVKR